MPKSQNKTTILDGKVHIYSRPNSPFFWCGFHHKGKYVRTSTRQELLTEAETFARNWYLDKLSEIKAGTLRVGGVKFGKAAEHALKIYQQKVDRGERSAEYLRGITTCLSARVLPYFRSIPVDQINTVTWSDYKQHIYDKHPTSSSRATLHQHKNAVRVVLNEAHKKGWLPILPVFKDDYANKNQSQPRTWFEPPEYKMLYKETRANIARLKKTRHAEGAKELHDYVIFVANTGLRIGEANNLRFCDVEIIKTLDDKDKKHEVLLLKNIRGKRGTGECKSYYGAVAAYRRIVARRKPKSPNSSEKLFLAHHRDMFNEILKRKGLKLTNDTPPARRDLMSLRHTYICFRILGGANVYDIAINCRTSVQMIEEHYARRLRPRMSNTINRTLASSGFGAERA